MGSLLHIQSHAKSEGIRKAKARKKEGLFYFYFFDTSRIRLPIQQSKPIPKSRGNQSTSQKKNRSAFMDKHICPQKEPHIVSLKAEMKF